MVECGPPKMSDELAYRTRKFSFLDGRTQINVRSLSELRLCFIKERPVNLSAKRAELTANTAISLLGKVCSEKSWLRGSMDMIKQLAKGRRD